MEGYERAKRGKRQGEEEVRGDGRRMRTVKRQVQKHRHLTESLGKEDGEGCWFKCY